MSGAGEVTRALEERVDALNALVDRLREGASDRVVRLSEEALRAAQAIGYLRGEATALCHRGFQNLMRAEFAASGRDYGAARDLARSGNLPALEARACVGLAVLLRKRLDYDGAVALLEFARRRARESADPVVEMTAWHQLAALYRELGDIPGGIAAAVNGLGLLEQEGTEVCGLFCRAELVLLRCDARGADHCIAGLEACLKSARVTGARHLEGQVLAALCDIHLRMGNKEAALAANEDGLAQARATGDRHLEMLLLLRLGEACAALHLDDAARSAFERARARARAAEDFELLLQTLTSEAAFRERAGDRAGGEPLYREADTLAGEAGSWRHQAVAAAGIVRLALARGDTQMAEIYVYRRDAARAALETERWRRGNAGA